LLFVESPLAGVHRSPLGCGPVGCRWHKGFGPRVHESTDIPPLKNTLSGGSGLKCRCHRDFRPRSHSRRSTIIIMRATLHDHAPNTYYGHWPRFFGPQSRPRLASQCPSRGSVGPLFHRVIHGWDTERRCPRQGFPPRRSATVEYNCDLNPLHTPQPIMNAQSEAR